MTRAWRTVHARGEDGFTLIELGIVAALMSLVALLVSSTVISGLRVSTRGEHRTDDAGNAQRVMLQLTADLRASDGVLVATPSKVELYTRSRGDAASSFAAAPDRVTWELTGGGELTTTRQAGAVPTGGQWTAVGSPVTSTALRGVRPTTPAGAPLFRYLSRLDSQRQCLSGATTGSLGSTVTGLNDLDLVYSVEVWLSVNSAPQLGARPLVVPGGAVIASEGTLKLDPANLAQLGLGQGCT